VKWRPAASCCILIISMQPCELLNLLMKTLLNSYMWSIYSWLRSSLIIYIYNIYIYIYNIYKYILYIYILYICIHVDMNWFALAYIYILRRTQLNNGMFNKIIINNIISRLQWWKVTAVHLLNCTYSTTSTCTIFTHLDSTSCQMQILHFF